MELHGFSDASEAAYAAVVYVQATYQNHSPTCRIVMSKTKIAPVKSLSMSRLELCGATLLSKVLTTVRQTLNIPIEDVHAWSDSSIVIAWLDGSPKCYKTYVGNRIAAITNLIPPSSWRHVPTTQNPADCASRGISPIELRDHSMWWSGHSWLLSDPVQVPNQPAEAELSPLRDLESKPLVCNIVVASPANWMHNFCSCYTYKDKSNFVYVHVHRNILMYNMYLHTIYSASEASPTLGCSI